MKTAILSLTLLLPLLLSACAHHEQIQPQPEPARAAMVTPPPPPTATGSLWTEQKGGLFYDQKARYVGDIITVAINESASASKEATTETGRTSSMNAGINNLFGFEADLAKLKTGLDPTKLVDASFTNSFSGNGETTRSEDLTATLTTQVVEVLPNGNLRIDGGKAVQVNNETQVVRLSGIVRPQDVSARNIVDSSYILDARIEYTGKGAISDKQRPGWLVRLLDAVSPF